VTSPKHELLTRAAREYKAFHDALHGLNEDQMTERWLGDWSIREVVAHIAGWQRELTPALGRLARGERPIPEGVDYQDVDRWNAKFAAAVPDGAVANLLLDLDACHERFMLAADAIPDARYRVGSAAYRIVDQCTAHHYNEHTQQILAWRVERGI
jgi:hypothetical protein